ncbi:MAG: ABC transporter permease [Paracoccaceae bacterium]|nr:MAG: ABC transporter permease [Alphaproteobacteria bacterium]GIX15019.1 MAG: ABC transporter permease [Paracoccaceae bacterium]
MSDRITAAARRESLALLAPGIAVLLLAFLLPVAVILVTSVRDPAGGLTAAHFAKFFVDDYYLRIAWRTLRLALAITAVTVIFGLPLAWIMVRAGPRLRFAIMLMVILPLMTSVVIRTFGWLVVLGNGGLLARLGEFLGLDGRALVLMHTETGVVIAMAQVLLPFMVLTLLGVLRAIPRDLEEAARTMGAGFWATMRLVVLPLAVPGIVSGSLIVFALSISSFITPSLVGGVRLPVLASSIYQSIGGSFDWPFAAAQSVLLLAATLAVIIPYTRLARGRT